LLLASFFFDPEDGDTSFLRNVCKLISDYTASYPRRFELPMVGFEVLTPVTVRSTVFWAVTPCSLVALVA
jgi:hypothetical protein